MIAEVLEILILVVVIGIQIYVFVKNFYQIQLFETILPKDKFSLHKILVERENLEQWSPEEILEYYSDKGFNANFYDPELEENESKLKKNGQLLVNILKIDSLNPIGLKIEKSINHYLIRNHNTTTDFNLIKDIVERHSVSEEENINQSVSVPLYVGLMGTMIGIVIGLFSMSVNFGANDIITIDNGISTLINGVKIAMIASFIGLLLTVIGSGWLFKAARRKSEERRNEFYTFIQVNLLPVINNDLSSTFDSLQRNLLKFNNSFSTNLGDLKGLFDGLLGTMREQKEFLLLIENMNLSKMAKYNVSVLSKVEETMNEFDKFNHFMSNLNDFIFNSQLIVTQTNELLQRTDNFNLIAENISNRLDQSERLIQFLNLHFAHLEDLKDKSTMATVDVSIGIKDIFDELKTTVRNLSEDVTRFTVNETELIKDALSSGSNLKKLDNLDSITKIQTDFNSFKTQSQNQNSKIHDSIEILNNTVAKLMDEVKTGKISIEFSHRETNVSKLLRNIDSWFFNLLRKIASLFTEKKTEE